MAQKQSEIDEASRGENGQPIPPVLDRLISWMLPILPLLSNPPPLTPQFCYLSQWKDGTLMVSQDGAFLLQVTKQEKPEEEEDVVIFELRSRQPLGTDEPTTPEAVGQEDGAEPPKYSGPQLKSAHLLWQRLTPIARVFESTLLSYKGYCLCF
ncbi:unnamed protein product [Schistocephalus solidus]|uniref:Interleukin-1 n=1 Tax=Schistocephalus solidus TaxID=70667 RepID=A0A183TCK1_SCHSO|nr:unnamed protein product [Schistocephalus solidus]